MTTNADSTHSHSLTMPRNPIQLGAVLCDRAGLSASGGGITRRWNTDGAQAAVFGALDVGQGTMPWFGCEVARDKESAPIVVTTSMAVIASLADKVFEKLVAMKPHTGPAAGKHDPGG
jgi:hypothetical protein